MRRLPPENPELNHAKDTKGTLGQWALANLPNFIRCDLFLDTDNGYAIRVRTSKPVGEHDRRDILNLAGDVRIEFAVAVPNMPAHGSRWTLFGFIPRLLGRIRARRMSA